LKIDPVRCSTYKAVHYPADRRFRVWIKPSCVAGAAAVVLAPFFLAWAEAVFFGLPYWGYSGLQDSFQTLEDVI
jgi:hypothetical protein